MTQRGKNFYILAPVPMEVQQLFVDLSVLSCSEQDQRGKRICRRR